MSKSKKNVIDPENMIKTHMEQMLFGGLYFLIVLLKKIFNGQIKVLTQHINFFKKFIIYVVLLKKDLKKRKLDKDFNLKMNSYINKITKSINNFNLNVVVANVYEIYNLFYDHT